MLLVLHAWAGKRSDWAGDDSERPLDERGRVQALELVSELMPFQIERILSSPYRRCVETVEPVARARGVEIECRAELSEESQDDDGAALVRELIDSDNVLVCGHGGLEHAIPGAHKLDKGEILVV